MPTPEELEAMLRRREDVARFKQAAQGRAADKMKQNAEDVQLEAQYKRELEEIKGSFRNQSGADWLTVMMAMIRTMSAHARAMHASSSAKRAEDAISATPKALIAAAKAWVKDSLSWNANRFLEKRGLKEREKLPDITFNVKINDDAKDGSFDCKALINGSISLENYFLDDDDAHTKGFSRNPKKAGTIAEEFEAHFQQGFEGWIKSKGCSIKDQKIMDADGKTPLTQAKLEALNKGPGKNLADFLQEHTKLNVTSDPNTLPDASPSPVSTTPKPK